MPRVLVAGDDHNLLANRNQGDPHRMYLQRREFFGDFFETFVPGEKFGLRPDTGADMTDAWNRAFDECDSGATLAVRPGHYVVTSDLTCSRRINVWAKDVDIDIGSAVLTTAALTIGDPTGVGQVGDVTWFMPRITRSFTNHDQTSLLYIGVRLYACFDSTFDKVYADGFQQGLLLTGHNDGVSGRGTTGCFISNPRVIDCRFGYNLAPVGFGWVNENTFIRGRHLHRSTGWTQAELEDAALGFEHVRILWDGSAGRIPNNNTFISCNFEGFSRRKIRNEGARNKFSHCRYEGLGAGIRFTTGNAAFANANFGGNIYDGGAYLETALTNRQFEFLSSDFPGVSNRTRIFTEQGSWWSGGNAGTDPALILQPTSTDGVALKIRTFADITNAAGERFAFFPTLTLGGASKNCVTRYANVSGTTLGYTYLDQAALGGSARPPWTIRSLGLMVNPDQTDADCRISGLGELELTHWDANARGGLGGVGFGVAAPARLVEMLDASNPQLRLTHTAGSRYTDIQVNNDATFGGLCLLPAANASGFFAVNVFGTNEGSGLTIFDDGTDYYLRTGVARNFTINVPSGQQARLQQNFATYIGIDASGEASCNTPFSASTTLASDTVGKAFGVVATRSGGLPAAGFGSMMEFTLEADDGSDPGTFVVAAQWQAVWDNPSSAVPDSSTRFILRDAGTLKEIMRVAGALPGVRIENGVGGAPAALLDVRGDAIFNEDGASVDWRAEGDTDPNLLFLDGSADFVGIGTNTPGAKLDVRGGAIFNEDGNQVDFRVESDTLARMLFVDGTNNRVGIGYGAGSPLSTLDVNGTIRATSSPILVGGNPAGGVVGFVTLTNLVTAPNGATPATPGNTGGAGDPAGAAQSHWLKIWDGTTARYIPVWT